MQRKSALTTAALAALAGAIGGVATIETAEAQATMSWSGAPRTREEDREFKVNGRIHYDAFSIEQDAPGEANDIDYSGSFARRAFIGVEGRFTRNWRYNVKFDLSPSASNNVDEVRLDDAYLEYADDAFSLVIGQNNAISHLEDRTSSNYTPFNERSMIDQAFGFGKIFGVGALTNGGNWSAGVAYYQDSLNSAETSNVSDPSVIFGRITWAPVYQRTPEGVALLHLGLNARHRDAGGGLYSYAARPNQNSLSGLSSTVSSQGSWGSDDLYGVELAGQWNAFGFTAEYMTLTAQRSGASPIGLSDEAEATGGYVDFFWSPTGESRNYSAVDGSWGRITPRRTFGSDGIGHVMLSARYEWLDFGDQNFAASIADSANRGEQTGYVAGVTWAPIGYVKFQLNYGQYELDRPDAADDDRQWDVVSLRTQLDW